MKELNVNEVEQVNGGLIQYAAGAAAGAIGGFYGSIIAGGPSASGWDIARGTLLGAVAGTFSPVKAIGNAVAVVGAGVTAGGVSSVIDEVRSIKKK